MYIFNFWNQLYLHRKKTLICLILFSSSAFTYAQKKHLYLINIDKKAIHFGFQIGVFRSYLNVTNSYLSSNPNNIAIINAVPKLGLTVGFLINLSLADELWDLRLSPNVSFYERSMEVNLNVKDNSVETTVLELPILLQYKSIRRGNLRMYLLGGITGGIEVGGRNKNRRPEQLALNIFNLELTYGIGLDKYLKFVKFSPEVRFSHSLNNLIKDNGSPAALNIHKLTTNRVSFIINFEG